MKIQMNACQCGEHEFKIEHTDLVSACGYLECEVCGAPILPVDVNDAAVEVAMDKMKGERLAWKPSEWIDTLTARRDAILKSWAETLDEYRASGTYDELRKSPPSATYKFFESDEAHND